MGRVAVLMAEGFEEGETLTVVDLLCRGGLECHTFRQYEMTRRKQKK